MLSKIILSQLKKKKKFIFIKICHTEPLSTAAAIYLIVDLEISRSVVTNKGGHSLDLDPQAVLHGPIPTTETDGYGLIPKVGLLI